MAITPSASLGYDLRHHTPMARPVRSLPLPMPKSSSTPVLSPPVEVGLMAPGDDG